MTYEKIKAMLNFKIKNIDEDDIVEAFKIRIFEEFLLHLFSEGKVNGTVHTCIGQEFIPVLLKKKLTPNDMIFSNHRGHGHYLSITKDYAGLLLEIMGSSDGCSGGIGGSQHIMRDNFISNGIQGGMAPISAGWGYNQSQNIAVCYIGDGTLGEGQFYEAMNLASIHNSSVLYVLEDNKYAQSTPAKFSLKGSIEDRIKGFGLDYFNGNIWDLERLSLIMTEAVQNVRNGRPTVLHVDCYRLMSHSKGDDNRDPVEVKKYNKKDVLNQLVFENKDYFSQHRKNIISNLREITNAEIRENFNRKSLSYSLEQTSQKTLVWSDVTGNKKNTKRLNSQINEALAKSLKNEVYIIGEDILDVTPQTPIEYGGAFKVTKGLSTSFPKKVLGSSISEAGIVGFGIGLALSGRKAICEIMFGDFMTLTVDQIVQQMSKIPGMYGKEISLPVVVRTPMGGRRGYGPTHSQNLERLFLYWPNVQVFALSQFIDCEKLVYSLIEELSQPTILIEDKVSYTFNCSYDLPPGYEQFELNDQNFTIKFEPKELSFNCTICCYGGISSEVLNSVPDLMQEEIFPRIYIFTRLDKVTSFLIDEISSSNVPIVFIEEGSKYGGWSSEISFLIQRRKELSRKIHRLSNNEIIGCSRHLENSQIINASSLAELIKDTIYD